MRRSFATFTLLAVLAGCNQAATDTPSGDATPADAAAVEGMTTVSFSVPGMT